jgi:sulfite reductase (NADPH) flavoprotein alpha-component
MPLARALLEQLDITIPSPRFLAAWATLTASSELASLASEGADVARRAFLRAHHLLDIVHKHPAKLGDAQKFVELLRPLAPRLYSLASSQAVLPSEAHLTVSLVRYTQHGRTCQGVASGHIADTASEGKTLKVYVQPNPGFRLPDNPDTPIVMIGAGTGVAPYRAFVQERAARPPSGPSWLFFGERNFRSDFLYQTEWQTWLKSGALTKLTPAFSRDQADKVYVQKRIREQGRELYDWLERGAHVYVCGDAEAMAPAVHEALIDIVLEQRSSRDQALEYLHNLREQKRYQRDVY